MLIFQGVTKKVMSTVEFRMSLFQPGSLVSHSTVVSKRRVQCLPLSPRSAKVAWRSLLPACHVAHLRCRLPCYRACGSYRLDQRAPQNGLQGGFVRMWGLNIYIYIQLYFLLLYVKLFLFLRCSQNWPRWFTVESWKMEASIISNSHLHILSLGLFWVSFKKSLLSTWQKKCTCRKKSFREASINKGIITHYPRPNTSLFRIDSQDAEHVWWAFMMRRL